MPSSISPFDGRCTNDCSTCPVASEKMDQFYGVNPEPVKGSSAGLDMLRQSELSEGCIKYIGN